MGADGHIQIWRDDKVREAFPDCDELFSDLPTHYSDELDGVKYHHCYWGDNMMVRWDDPDDWYMAHYRPMNGELTPEQEKENRDKKKRLTEFVNWLNANGTYWEVWT